MNVGGVTKAGSTLARGLGLGSALSAMLLALSACAATPPQAIGPVVAPPAKGPVSSDCPPGVQGCERRPVSAAAADLADLARLVQTADDLLFSGDERAAWGQLNQALKIDPRHRPALLLMSQITDDPRKLLGDLTETYTPMPGETLRQIAAARLGDAHWFYALARYNNIAVPRDLDATRSLKVPPRGGAPRLRPAPARAATSPGPAVAPLAATAPVMAVPAVPTAPAAAPSLVPSLAVPAAPPALAAPGLPNLNNLPPTSAGPVGSDADQAFRRASAAEKAGKIDQAYALYMRALTLGHAGAAERAGVMRQELIARYRRDARVALERQDPERAIKAWRFVLELDPDDAMATAELRKLQRRKDAPKAQ